MTQAPAGSTSHYYLLTTVLCVVLGYAPTTTSAEPPAQQRPLMVEDPTFGSNPALDAPLTVDKIDWTLLDNALFVETRTRRSSHEQKLPLTFDEAVYRTAIVQATAMAERQTTTHENPESPEIATLEKRLAHQGVQWRQSGENVAMASLLRPPPGSITEEKKEDGTTIVTSVVDPSHIQPHTYRTFAHSVVDGWMNSPGHRANILNGSFTRAGVACRHAPQARQLLYCAQVFIAP